MTNKNTLIYNSLLKMLDTADTILGKAEAYVSEGKATEAELIDAKLIADMMPFVRQIQILTDNVKGAVARLTGAEAPMMADNEATLAELKQRVEKTREFAKSVDTSKLANDIDNTSVRLNWMPEGMSWTGKQYTESYILQNSYFHLVTAYDIMRMKGVQLGKMDFIGQL